MCARGVQMFIVLRRGRFWMKSSVEDQARACKEGLSEGKEKMEEYELVYLLSESQGSGRLIGFCSHQ